MGKVNLVVEVIEKRIANADHLLKGLPSERRLCEELGMSRTTVRTAVQKLVQNGVLRREKNGRLALGREGSVPRNKRIGFVAPVGVSADVHLWDQGVSGALEGHDVTLRRVVYAHIRDSVISDAIASFDGLFFVTQSQPIPPWLAAKMKESRCRVVVLDRDETAAGLPSVTMFPPESERKLFDHLVELGHRRIDCLATQEGTDQRIAVWKQYLSEHNLAGQLRSRLIRRPLESGYSLVQEALAEGRPLASALFCTSGPAAIGAMRALHEAKLKIGSDVSVCAVNDEGIGHYLLKTLTAMESPPRTRYLLGAAEWMLGEEPWTGPLLVQPDDVPLFIGESTGPAPGASVVVAGTAYPPRAASSSILSVSSF